MSKFISIVIATILIVGTWYMVTSSPSTSDTNVTKKVVQNTTALNSEMKNGVQYISITARGGYSPRNSTAKAGIPTKLVIKTNDTYDCSAALIVRALNFRKMLPSTGETVLDVGVPEAGDYLQGVCGMGMYGFVVSFN